MKPAKAVAPPKSVEEYLDRVPERARTTLEKIRKTVRSVVPRDTEEVLSYGIPAFRHGQVLVWYAAFAKHCSFFPTAAVIDEFADELKGYKLSKGTIQFPMEKPLPATLIKKLVKARLDRVNKKP
jgi:uncharacterized protein YdhG (YjbR/CyaY superfamily)